MADWALYLDESGDTRRHSLPLEHGQTPLFTLGGVALPLFQWRAYHREYTRLKIEFFRKEIDQSSKDAAAWEIKGSALIAPRNAKSERNAVFVHKTIDLIRRYQGRLFAVTFLKNYEKPMAAQSMYTKALQVIAERYDTFARDMDSDGIIIVDSRMAHVTPGRGTDYQVAVSHLTYVFGHHEGRLLNRLIEAPMFADSATTAGVQMADVIAAVVYGTGYVHRLAPEGTDHDAGFLDYRHNKRFKAPLNEAQFVSRGKKGGYRLFGFRTIDNRHQKKPS